MTETMLVLSFLMLMIMGTITLCLLMTSKQVADFAAFSAARASLVYGFHKPGWEPPPGSQIVSPPAGASGQTGWTSAAQVLYHTQHWWESESANAPGSLELETKDGAEYLVVPYRVPYGLPIFNELPSGGLLIQGRSRIAQQPEALTPNP